MTFSYFVGRRLFGLRWRWEKIKNKVYDWRHGMDTHQECFLNTQGVSEQQAQQGNDVYRPFWRKEFFDAIESLDINLTDYMFVDIGAGKGKLLLLASHLPFSEIVGIEFAPKLHAVALRNLSRLESQTKITSIKADALSWDLPNRPAIYFLYNPFDLATTRSFFSRLDQHAAKTRLSTFMIYANLRGVVERQEAFASARSLVLKTRTPRYLVYESRANP